jgi:hypothetical protein
VFVNVEVYPLQEIGVPLIAAGVLVTVTVFVAYTVAQLPDTA